MQETLPEESSTHDTASLYFRVNKVVARELMFSNESVILVSHQTPILSFFLTASGLPYKDLEKKLGCGGKVPMGSCIKATFEKDTLKEFDSFFLSLKYFALREAQHYGQDLK